MGIWASALIDIDIIIIIIIISTIINGKGQLAHSLTCRSTLATIATLSQLHQYHQHHHHHHYEYHRHHHHPWEKEHQAQLSQVAKLSLRRWPTTIFLCGAALCAQHHHHRHQ